MRVRELSQGLAKAPRRRAETGSLIALLAVTFGLCTPTFAQTIITVSGTGTAGSSGDGGPATEAQLNGPAGVFVDAAGNLFISEIGGHRIRKVDPAGTIFLFLVGFGWGKPVPVNPNVSNNPKAMMAIVAGAGPVSNFLVAALAGLPLQLGLVEWLSPFNFVVLDRFLFVGFGFDEYLGLYLSAIVLISIILGVFNLLPIFPLDGHRVIPAFLSDQAAHTYMQFQSRYGFFILIALIALPFLTGGQFGVLFEVMSPIINVLARLFAGIDEDVFG